MELNLSVADLLEELNISITVTDREGQIIYLNQASAQVNAKGGGKQLVGRQVRDCHSDRSKDIIEQLMQGSTNVYTIDKRGQHKLIYQTPWKKDGKIQGLIEFSLVLPADMPNYVRE